MWGKLTERNNRRRTKMTTDPQELYRFLATPGVEVAALVFASNEVVCKSCGISPTKKCLIYIIQTKL
jgi:hypothetical protein